MQAKVKQVVAYMEELAPPSLALPGDHVGLQLGNPGAYLSKVLVAMDPDQIALDEASSRGAGMLVCHHPLFFNKVSSLDEDSTLGALVAEAIRKRLSVYCAHTNYDIAPGGVSYQLAEKLGLPAQGSKVLEVTTEDQLLKLVVFIPSGHENSVLDAIALAGAGHIGKYSHCAFQTTGIGSFMPDEEAQPYIGRSGRLEKVEEIRLETVLPESVRKAVIDALMKSHPYEEVAYDLYPLALPGVELGLGLLVELDKSITMNELLKRIRESLKVKDIRWWSPGQKTFRTVALCGGSGGSLIGQAALLGADIFIAGDFRYHDLKQAQSLNMALIDAGHDTSEQPGLLHIQNFLAERLEADGYQTEVLLQTSSKQSWY